MKNEQNSLDTAKYFKTTQKFYHKTGKQKINVKETPTIKELKSFWSNIWSHKKSYNKKERWIENIKCTYKNYEPQMYNDISTGEIIDTLHHHHHVVRLARISLALSLYVSQSFIASGRSSGLHPVSSHHCCMNVRAGRPAFDWQYAGVHRSTSLTISSLLLQQCPACLDRLACIVFVIGGR